MGIELISHNHDSGDLHYNLGGWQWLRDFAIRNGISINEFADSNDGQDLSEATCLALAVAIENHQEEYNEVFAGAGYGPAPAEEHARIWRESSGFEQW